MALASHGLFLAHIGQCPVRSQNADKTGSDVIINHSHHRDGGLCVSNDGVVCVEQSVR